MKIPINTNSYRMNISRIVFSMGSAILTVLFLLAAVQAAEHKPSDITDADITEAVETALSVDRAVSAHLIDVETNNGVVSLSGSVGNILAMERSVEIVRSVKGVRAIINRLNVKPVFRTDRELSEDIKKALLLDPATDSYEINVSVSDGEVTLTGNVESWAEKQLAEEVVKGVRGIKRVKNDVTIQYTEERLDAEIRADIERRLHSDLYVDEKLIDVQVNDGAVTLTGSVGSLDEKMRATADAWVNGTKSVDNDALNVQWWRSDEMKREDKFVLKSDSEIEKDVKASFLYDPRLEDFDINVSVKNGVATLTGVVDNLEAKRTAGEDAKNTIGVWMVQNHLKVRPTTLPEDSQLAVTIANRLEQDPYLDRHDITFAIRNYKVYLYGSVDTYFEKLRAADVVGRIPGVVVIENQLKVEGGTWEWKSDAEIREDVEDELFWSVFIDSDRIDVTVENGIVTLEGTVDTWQESKAAMENAIEGGARSVINHLTVTEIPEI